MRLRWTSSARADLERLYRFLARANGPAAMRAARALALAPERLLERPRIGEVLEEFQPREVRRVFVGKYELRYEIQRGFLYVLRLWHAREDR